MTPDKFIEECKKRNLVISEEMITQLDTYAKLLKEWNSKMNLTAIDEREEVYVALLPADVMRVPSVDGR